MPKSDPASIALEMYEFEAEGSRANTGAGGRQEGAGFEKVVRRWWAAVDADLVRAGATRHLFDQNRRRWARLSRGERSLIIPASTAAAPQTPSTDADTRWLETNFLTETIVESFARSQPDRIAKYPPSIGPYGGSEYPTIYTGLQTQFDDTVILEDRGVLKEKILLEYKSAKSTQGRQIDGNAHERLSFQMMQYLEIATRYTKCSFVVLANGAFVRYRNKYHVNFHMQADRLRNFAWFDMEHACTPDEFNRLHNRLRTWLLGTK
jgi:hypothetical protein